MTYIKNTPLIAMLHQTIQPFFPLHIFFFWSQIYKYVHHAEWEIRDNVWPTSKTSSSSILVPNTIIPLVSMMGLGLRSSFWLIFFLQSRMRVMVCWCTLIATRCHLATRGGVSSHTYRITCNPMARPWEACTALKFKGMLLCWFRWMQVIMIS